MRYAALTPEEGGYKNLTARDKMKNEVLIELGKLNGKQIQETNAELGEIGKRTKGRAEMMRNYASQIKTLADQQLKDSLQHDAVCTFQAARILDQAENQKSIAAIVSNMTTENESLRNSSAAGSSNDHVKAAQEETEREEAERYLRELEMQDKLQEAQNKLIEAQENEALYKEIANSSQEAHLKDENKFKRLQKFEQIGKALVVKKLREKEAEIKKLKKENAEHIETQNMTAEYVEKLELQKGGDDNLQKGEKETEQILRELQKEEDDALEAVMEEEEDALKAMMEEEEEEEEEGQCEYEIEHE